MNEASNPVPTVGLIDDMSAEDYHADPCETPSLSSSIASTLIGKSALHAWYDHPRFGRGKREASPSQKRGQVIHAILLEDPELEALAAIEIGEPFQVVAFDSFRTKAARESRDELKKLGILAMTPKQYDDATAAVAANFVTAKEAAKRLHRSGITIGPGEGRRCEVSMFWEETATDGTIVQCRGRLDQIEIGADRIDVVDLKSIRSAHPKQAERSVENYGYAIQRAAYVSALESIFPEMAGRVRYRWAFMEPEPPFAVLQAEASGELRELGEMRWRRAIDTWAECINTNRWPGYVAEGHVAKLDAMPWAMNQEIERKFDWAFGGDDEA